MTQKIERGAYRERVMVNWGTVGWMRSWLRDAVADIETHVNADTYDPRFRFGSVRGIDTNLYQEGGDEHGAPTLCAHLTVRYFADRDIYDQGED